MARFDMDLAEDRMAAPLDLGIERGTAQPGKVFGLGRSDPMERHVYLDESQVLPLEVGKPTLRRRLIGWAFSVHLRSIY